MSTSALPTIIAVMSMRSVAILWDRTHARVKQDTQEMGGRAMVRLFVLKTDHCTAITEPCQSCIKATLSYTFKLLTGVNEP